MKILQVVQSLGKGGAERLVLEVAQALRKYYPDVHNKIVALERKNEYEELSQGLDIVYCESKVRLSITGHSNIDVGEFDNIVKEYCPDVIHSHTYKSELVSREHLFPNVTYFTHTHNNMPEFRNFSVGTIFYKDKLTKFWEKCRIVAKYKKCNNKFIAISGDTERFYKSALPKTLIKNIYTLPNAIDYHKFYCKRNFEFSGSLNLIMVAHMSDNKNQIFLIDVLKKLRDQGVDTILTLVGDWRNNGEKIRRKSEQLGLLPFVKMPGLIEDVENIYPQNHIYVHSSLSEALGLTIIEAMAAGLPVVTLDGRGNRDLIVQGKNGYMVYEQDTEQFADRILEIWNDKLKYQEMSAFAQGFARQYDIKPYVDRLLELYKTN